MTHTPAPWKMRACADGADFGIGTPSGFICFMAGVSRYCGQEQRYIDECTERLANARLIIAAPNMLEALKDAHPYITDDRVRAIVGAAIMKATQGAA